jgi:hypothetical protein
MIASSRGELTICARGCATGQVSDNQKTTMPVANLANPFGRETRGNRGRPIFVTCRC